MDKCSRCERKEGWFDQFLMIDEKLVCHRCVTKEERNQIAKAQWESEKPFFKFCGFILLAFIELALGITLFASEEYPMPAETRVGIGICFVGIGIWLIKLFVEAIPAITSTIKKVLKIFGVLILVGLGIWFVWSFLSGLAAMSTTSFLLLIIIWQLSAMDRR